MIITVIGSGQMGSALSWPLRDNGHTVRLVGTPLDREIIDRLRQDRWHLNLKRFLPEGCEFYQFGEMEKALAGCDFVIGGVSSFGVDWFLENVLPALPETLPVLSVTKGLVDLEDGEMITYPEYYRRGLKGKKLSLNAIGGPCTAYELADRDPSTVEFCGEDLSLREKFRQAMRTDYYHISITNDVTGLETAVALKNAFALGVALAVGLSEKREGREGVMHYNSQAALFGQGVKEMRRIFTLTGVSEENIIFGAGDLYVTVYGGRTRKIGTLLGRGMSFADAKAALNGVTLESLVITTRMARAIRKKIARGEASEKDYPLLLQIDDIINHGAPVDIPWQAFEETRKV